LADYNMDFADTLLAVRMRRRGTVEVVSFDAHFEQLPGIRRVEPGAPGQIIRTWEASEPAAGGLLATKAQRHAGSR
jgi:hypothetical protein